MWHDSVCNTVQEPTVTSTIAAKKTTTWGESGFPSEFLATLPNEADLAKIQRYEAHISRQFYKALHELQMVQTGRQSLHPSAPLAIDVLDTISSQGE